MFAFGSWQGTAGSETLKLTVSNLGTRGYHLLQGIAGSQTLEYIYFFEAKRLSL